MVLWSYSSSSSIRFSRCDVDEKLSLTTLRSAAVDVWMMSLRKAWEASHLGPMKAAISPPACTSSSSMLATSLSIRRIVWTMYPLRSLSLWSPSVCRRTS